MVEVALQVLLLGGREGAAGGLRQEELLVDVRCDIFLFLVAAGYIEALHFVPPLFFLQGAHHVLQVCIGHELSIPYKLLLRVEFIIVLAR